MMVTLMFQHQQQQQQQFVFLTNQKDTPSTTPVPVSDRGEKLEKRLWLRLSYHPPDNFAWRP